MCHITRETVESELLFYETVHIVQQAYSLIADIPQIYPLNILVTPLAVLLWIWQLNQRYLDKPMICS